MSYCFDKFINADDLLFFRSERGGFDGGYGGGRQDGFDGGFG